MNHRLRSVPRLFAALLVLAGASFSPGVAQDRIKSMPGYDQYQKMRTQAAGAFRSGALTVRWVDEGRALEYALDGKRYRFDVGSRQRTEIGGDSGTASSASIVLFPCSRSQVFAVPGSPRLVSVSSAYCHRRRRPVREQGGRQTS